MSKPILITGGAGFIGTNYTARLIERGEHPIIFDNLSRTGTPGNIQWLGDTYGTDSFELIEGDIRDSDAVSSAIQGA